MSATSLISAHGNVKRNRPKTWSAKGREGRQEFASVCLRVPSRPFADDPLPAGRCGVEGARRPVYSAAVWVQPKEGVRVAERSVERTVQSYKVLVGMEIHVQLSTASKMFTGAANGFGGEPNSQVDPVVLGLPGVLPVMNKTAVEYAIKVGLALGCQIAKHTKWDRKSYYYPDLPKNYQISQYDLPLCAEGEFDLALKDGTVRKVRIRRAHLEEDAGKLLHDAPGGYHIDGSIVDLNRAGTPLLEVVTEPDLSSGEEVAAFGQELQKLVQFLGVSHGQMQMGHMRFEPNINVHITDVPPAEKDAPELQLATAFDKAAGSSDAVLDRIQTVLLSGLTNEFRQLRLTLSATTVTMADLPPDLVRSWVAPDGHARAEIFPAGDADDNEVLRKFVSAVRKVAPDATGTPVSIQESSQTIVRAFLTAGILATVGITILLALTLRKVHDVLVALIPLLLAALFTLATTVIIGMPLNFANIIALPLLLGIGVAFDIYFVMNWRAGRPNPLQSGTARAIVFSTLTTASAFGSLILSSHPGTSEMGRLLSIEMFYTLACVLLIMPSLLGAPKHRPAPVRRLNGSRRIVSPSPPLAFRRRPGEAHQGHIIVDQRLAYPGAQQRRQFFTIPVMGHATADVRSVGICRVAVELVQPSGQMRDQRQQPLLGHRAAPGQSEDPGRSGPAWPVLPAGAAAAE